MTAKRRRRLLWALLAIVVLVNGIAAMHAWRFTHFTSPAEQRFEAGHIFTFAEKLSMALTGVKNPRPESSQVPALPHSVLRLQSDVALEAWYIPAAVQPTKGTALLLHGYGGSKSDMLDKATIFHEMGYAVMIPDFRGAGGSEGNTCTIGYKEAADVAACYDYISSTLKEKRIVVLGTSMGAAALMKFIADSKKQPAAIILECPFGTMYQTVCKRFEMVHIPAFPMAGLLTFWGGTEHGFWAFGHNPATYAKQITCPTLLVFGAKDDRVTLQETEDIYSALAGPKQLKIWPEAGHNDYLIQYKTEWTATVDSFLHQ